MPWQRQVVDTALEVDPETGRLVYRTVVVTVPRQSGKTTLLLSVMVWRAKAFRRQTIVYTAQTRNDAREKWEDEHVETLLRSPYSPQFRVRKTNGSEAIRWRNGSLHKVSSTTEKSGHGKSLDMGVIDEAFAQVDFRLEQSMKPAMITRDSPQLWVISTAGTPESVYLKSKVEKGRERCEAGLTSSVAYFEWSADDFDDPADPATWRSCIPSIGYTVREEDIAAEFDDMPLPEFERAYLNRWNEGNASSPIPSSWWDRCEDGDAEIVGDVWYGVDISPDRAFGSISAAGQAALPWASEKGWDGPDVGHLIDLVDRREGTEWMVGRLVELWDRWNPVAVVIDDKGPAATLIPALEKAGVKIVTTNTGEMAQACGRLFDAVKYRRVVHVGQAEMAAAVAGARKRKLVDAWAWSRSSSSVDITPLVGGTLALHGAMTVTRAEVEDKPVFAWG